MRPITSAIIVIATDIPKATPNISASKASQSSFHLGEYQFAPVRAVTPTRYETYYAAQYFPMNLLIGYDPGR